SGNNMFSINLNHGGKFTDPPEGSFKSIVEIEGLNDDLELDAYVVRQSSGVTSKKVSVNEVNAEDSVSVDEVNVNLNMNDHGLDDNYEFPVQDNYNVNDYPMEENAEKGRGEEQPDEIVDEEHVINEVEVNMEDFNFSIGEKVNGHWKDQVVVNLTLRSRSCMKWKVFGIPSKHAVTYIFNMENNGNEVGVPDDWVHRSMRLQT
nr:hypothetical protein [Tanacetum cinerariifolium]